MRPTNPADRPDRPSLQYGTLSSGLNPAGATERGRGRIGSSGGRQQLAIVAVVLLAIVLLAAFLILR